MTGRCEEGNQAGSVGEYCPNGWIGSPMHSAWGSSLRDGSGGIGWSSSSSESEVSKCCSVGPCFQEPMVACVVHQWLLVLLGNGCLCCSSMVVCVVDQRLFIVFCDVFWPRRTPLSGTTRTTTTTTTTCGWKAPPNNCLCCRSCPTSVPVTSEKAEKSRGKRSTKRSSAKNYCALQGRLVCPVTVSNRRTQNASCNSES